MSAPCGNQVFGFFGGCIRGQEESWSNQEEGSQEEGCKEGSTQEGCNQEEGSQEEGC